MAVRLDGWQSGGIITGRRGGACPVFPGAGPSASTVGTAGMTEPVKAAAPRLACPLPVHPTGR